MALLRLMTRLSGVEAKWNAIPGQTELHVIWVTERRMAALNARFRGHRGTTDVLAFDLRPARPRGGAKTADEATVGGEVYVCPAVASRAAAVYSTTPEFELALYMIHGLLHLAGEDDTDPVSRRRMRQREKQIMSRLLQAGPLEDVFCFRPPVSAARPGR